MPRPCPECAQGKHLNCTNMAFNDQDQMVPCPCTVCHPPKE
jgi:hypothetical protein